MESPTLDPARGPLPVCIVGAGPAGLSAAVALRRHGIPFRILDAGRKPGGIWDIDRAETPMYDSAHFISSKTLSGFPDFPMPGDFPDYPRHDQIQSYIEAYAAHHGLTGEIDFGCTVTSVRQEGGGAAPGRAGEGRRDGDEPDRWGEPDRWTVRWTGPDGDASALFSGVIVATGVTWHPNVPEIPGTFQGEVRHSFHYRSADSLRGRRVLVVGAGNSGVDIACDAARSAEAAFISLRRGYHFVPKYVFGVPADVFAHGGPALPAWLEQKVFGFLINRVLVGDLTRYGLPEPDHPILTSHPIMNTQLLHYLGHGDIEAKPDVTRFDGDEVVFADDSRERIDLVLLATGYRRHFPFLELQGRRDGSGRRNGPASGPAAETEGSRGTDRGHDLDPDELYLTLIHRRHPSLFFMGIFETDGAAYEIFARQAELAARTLSALRSGSASAIRDIVSSDRPDLRGGRDYLDTLRHRFYVTDRRYRKAIRRFHRRMGWN